MALLAIGVCEHRSVHRLQEEVSVRRVFRVLHDRLHDGPSARVQAEGEPISAIHEHGECRVFTLDNGSLG